MEVGNSLLFVSPNEPGQVEEIVRFSPSRLSTEDFCPQKAHYSYAHQLALPPQKPSRAQMLGTLIHKFLELWHGPDHVHPSSAVKIIRDDPEFQKYEDQLLLYIALTYMTRYVAYYKNDPSRFKFLAIEKRLTVPFTTPRGHQVFLDGILDAIVEDTQTGKFGPWDHKTSAKAIWTKEVVAFERQLNQYLAMLYLMDYAPSLLTVNQIYTGKQKIESVANCPADELFSRHTIEVKPSRMEQWLQSIGHRIDQILEAGYVHKNLGGHCVWCPFRQACSMELDGIDPMPYLRTFSPRSEGKEPLQIVIDIEEGLEL